MDFNNKILIVDDEEDIRELLAMMIKELGFSNIETVGNGNDALAHISDNDVGLVISDLNMPHMGGIELLKQVREREFVVKRFLFISGDDAPTLSSSDQDHFEIGFLQKPFHFDDLQTALERFYIK